MSWLSFDTGNVFGRQRITTWEVKDYMETGRDSKYTRQGHKLRVGKLRKPHFVTSLSITSAS